jgi:hypothetical protein
VELNLPTQEVEEQEVKEATLSSQDQEETPQNPANLPSLSLSSPPPNPADWGRQIQPWSSPVEHESEQETDSSEVVSHLPEVEVEPSVGNTVSEATPEPEKVTWKSENFEATTEALEEAPAVEATVDSQAFRDNPTAASLILDPSETTEDMVGEESEPPFPVPETSAKTINWPSPTLSPVRSPKKRKSFAAVDLPSFPRFR